MVIRVITCGGIPCMTSSSLWQCAIKDSVTDHDPVYNALSVSATNKALSLSSCHHSFCTHDPLSFILRFCPTVVICFAQGHAAHQQWTVWCALSLTEVHRGGGWLSVHGSLNANSSFWWCRPCAIFAIFDYSNISTHLQCVRIARNAERCTVLEGFRPSGCP